MIVVTRKDDWAAIASETEKVEKPVFVFHCILSRKASIRLFKIAHRSNKEKTPDSALGVVIETGLRALEDESIEDCKAFFN